MSDCESQRKRCGEGKHTVFAAEDEPVQPIEAEKVEEVPRERGNPPHVHIGGLNSSL